MHLISKNRYPITNNPSLETIVGYLLEAPKIVRDLQPVQWQYLDAPPDGTVLLSWQPLEYMGTNYASDGYVWADAEQTFKSDVRGYTLEMFHQRSGFRMQGEAVANHSRRRYRLLQSNPNMPAPDPALFVVHYSKAHSRDTVPAATIPIMPHVQQQIQQRRVIQAQGALARKDFMLHDRSNWPTINVPQGAGRGQVPGPGHRRGGSLGVNESTLEEEEDVSRGDILDFMTPRDISRMRYEQHHEWMEEILESPYNVYQIVPGDLGLGRKGELEELTKDFFDAPTAIMRESTGGEPARVGKMENDKAKDFTKRASDKIAAMQKELDQMKARHAKRMQRLQRTTMLNTAERRLRTAPTALSARSMSNDDAMDEGKGDALDEIADEVQNAMGKKIEKVQNVQIVSKGGLDDRTASLRSMSTSSATRPNLSPTKTSASPSLAQTTTQQSPAPVAAAQQMTAQVQQADTQMSNEEDEQKQSANNTPQSLGDQMDGADDVKSEGGSEEEQETDLPPMDDMGMEVDLPEMEDEQQDEQGDNPDGSEWVMVDENAKPEAPEAADDQAVAEEAIPTDQEAAQTEEPEQPATTAQDTTSAEEATAREQPLQNTDANNAAFDLGDDFDNVDVDTAGDALASYDDGDQEELVLDTLDDSAFGDAFHQEEEAQQTPDVA